MRVLLGFLFVITGLASPATTQASFGVSGTAPSPPSADPAVRVSVVIGQVIEQGTLVPVRGAVVSAFIEAAGSGVLEAVAVARTDEEGLFTLTLDRNWTVRLQAEVEGRTSALSEPLRVGDVGEDRAAEVLLVLPSPVLGLAYACEADFGDGFTAVVGAVLDPVAEVRVPMARVTVEWDEGAEMRRLSAHSDGAGYYRICGIPPEARFLRIRGEGWGQRGPMEEVEVLRPTFVFRDIPLHLATAQARMPDLIQERILLEAAAHGLGDLGGEIRDLVSGAPVQQAIVRLQGSSLQAVTDAEGRFGFGDIRPGVYRIQIRHIGFQVESEPVELPAGQDVFLRLQVAPQAIALEGIEVTARSAVQDLARLTPFRRDIIYGETLAGEEARGARAFEVLRRSVPGLQVTELNNPGDPNRLCVQTTRRVAGLSGSTCQMVQVVLDDIRIPPGEEGDLLRSLSAAEIESVEFVSPTQATTRFGTGGNVANGVVLIYTRGRGPYVSPLRNLPPGRTP